MTNDGGPWRSPPPPRRGPPPRRLGLWAVFLLGLIGLVAGLAHAFPESVRTTDDWARVVYMMGFLLLVTAGVFRSGRIMRPEHLRYAAIWTAIVGVLALGFAYRDQLSEAPSRLKLAFSAGDPVATKPGEVVIPRDQSGHYIVVGQVNGQRVRFLVDTGASDTVLSPQDAQRIGLPLADLRYVRAVETANGEGYAAPVVADRFEIGPIALSNFGVAVNQAPMSVSLLGMSFLNRLESFHFEGSNLVLRWREAG